MPDPNVVTASLKNISCQGGSDGTITVDVPTCGKAPFSFSINGNAAQTSNIFPDLSAGTYTIAVIDADNNSIDEEFQLVEPNAINIIESDVTDASCSTSNDGQISLLVTGGTLPYQFSVDGENYQTSAIFENLRAGNFTVIVRDSLLCSTTVNLTVNAPDELLLNAQIVNTPWKRLKQMLNLELLLL